MQTSERLMWDLGVITPCVTLIYACKYATKVVKIHTHKIVVFKFNGVYYIHCIICVSFKLNSSNTKFQTIVFQIHWL